MVKRKGIYGLSASFHCHRTAHSRASVKPWFLAAAAFGVAYGELADASPSKYSYRTDFVDRSSRAATPIG
jgi:hypothetical protein